LAAQKELSAQKQRGEITTDEKTAQKRLQTQRPLTASRPRHRTQQDAMQPLTASLHQSRQPTLPKEWFRVNSTHQVITKHTPSGEARSTIATTAKSAAENKTPVEARPNQSDFIALVSEKTQAAEEAANLG
jgi:hypothetical protein